jgi:hypothetical protein
MHWKAYIEVMKDAYWKDRMHVELVGMLGINAWCM